MLNCRQKKSSEKINSVRNSKILKRPATQRYGKLYSLSTGSAEFLISIVLRDPLVFLAFTGVTRDNPNGDRLESLRHLRPALTYRKLLCQDREYFQVLPTMPLPKD